jgi:hypothetical protein
MTDGRLTAFGAVAIPTGIGGRPLRRYIVDCEHATTELTLQRGDEDDREVLTRLLEQHHTALATSKDGPCECQPTSRQLGILSAILH